MWSQGDGETQSPSSSGHRIISTWRSEYVCTHRGIACKDRADIFGESPVASVKLPTDTHKIHIL